VGSIPPTTRCERNPEFRTRLRLVRADFSAIPDTIPSADGISPRPPGVEIVNHSRRLSQAISEGDGISLLVPVDRVEDARAAEKDGAEGIVVSGQVEGLREATALPLLYRRDSLADAISASADACVLRVESSADELHLRDLHAEAQQLGLEPVIGVRDDEELELALEEIDPEIVLLSALDADDDGDPLEHVLDLLPDVPAGKLAIAEVQIHSREDVIALERAGVDAVIVSSHDVPRLVGGAPPEV
jgi:indole-3-glycerol phosphate synthase